MASMINDLRRKADVLLFSIQTGRTKAKEGERMFESAFDDMERRCMDLVTSIQETEPQVVAASVECQSGQRTGRNAILQ
jgi:hypothetical protein